MREIIILRNIRWSLLIPVVFAFIFPLFVNYLPARDYLLHLAICSLWFGVVASSWNLISGYAGQPSFAHAALVGVGGYTSTLLDYYLGIPAYFGFFAGGLLAAALGFVIGIVSLRVRGPYFFLVTIGIGEIFRLVIINEWKITGGTAGLSINGFMGIKEKLFHYYLILSILLITIYIIYRIINSPFGLSLQALRDREEAAVTIGINATRQKVLAFVTSSFIAGVAGAFYAHYMSLMSPEPGSLTYMLMFMSATVMGGRNTLAGPVIGGVFMEVLWEVTRIFWPREHFIFLGIVLLFTLKFSPRGVVFLIRKYVKM